MEHRVQIKSIGSIHYNILGMVVEKPEGYEFEAGQATELSIDQKKWRDQKKPSTFTNLPTDADLEFTIKVYPERNGVTEKLATLASGDSLIIRDPFGAIQYKGRGTFLARAGVTPFISILKSLEFQDRRKGNTLVFANKEEKDLFLGDKFHSLLGNGFINILSREKTDDHHFGRIDKTFLETDIPDLSQFFYVCGPKPMINDLVSALGELEVRPERIVIESL